MLDADTVFERLLREAANLVPKMSTPKLTNALKVTSTLQQKITETVASRLQHEKSDMQFSDTSNRLQQQQQPSIESIFPQTVVVTDSHSTCSSAPPTAVCETTDNETCSSSTASKGIGDGPRSMPVLSYLNHTSNNPSDIPNSSENSMTSTMTVVTSARESSARSLILPFMPQLHISNSASASMTSSSDQLGLIVSSSVCGDPMTTNTSMFDSSCTGFIVSDGLTSTSHCNGRKSASELTISDSDRNETITIGDESMDMKPEPSECITVTTLDSSEPLLSADPPDLTSSVYSHLTSMEPLLSHGHIPPTFATSTAATATPVVSMRPATHLDVPDSVVTLISNNPSELVTSSPGSKQSHNNGPYRCNDCDKEFRILRYLEKHKRIHTGEKPYQCCYCGRQFNDWPNMNRHKRIHTGERPYRCSVCSKTFSQPAVYNEHVKRHTGERPYICMVCAKGFPRAARLAVHMRVHTGERPYPCTSCDRRFSQPHHLAAHLRVHSGDRPYSCSRCEVSFACISNLRRHRKQVHPNSPSPNKDNESIVTLDEKKPIHALPSLVAENEIGGSVANVNVDSSLLVTSTALATDTPVALAAAVSGSLLTATGALVPANLLPSSSIPGLILTSHPPGALLATAAQFGDHQGQLQPALLAHTSAPDSLLKSVSSSTVSLMLPTVLTGASNAEGLRQTAVTLLAPGTDFDRTCASLAGTALANSEGGLVLNPASGETVYLEPLDPRMTFEGGQQFTIATIPTSHPHGATTLLGQTATGAHILGHPVQLPPGAHIAFTTNFPSAQHSQLLPPNSSVFQTNTAVPTQTALYSQNQPTTVLFPSPAAAVLPSSSAVTTTMSSQQLRQPSLIQASPLSANTSSSSVQYQQRPSASPGRPSSTPTNQQLQATMFVPVFSSTASSNSTVVSASESGIISLSNAAQWPGGFVTLTAAHPSPSDTSSVVHDEHLESTGFVNSRPSSAISNTSSLGTVTVQTLTDTNL